MFTLGVLLTTLLLFLAVGCAIIFVGGGAFLIVFGDIAIGIFIIVMLIRLLFFRKKKE